MQQLLAANKIYRGNPDIPDGTNSHDAQSRIGQFTHIDGDVLDGQSTEFLAGLILHEGWHQLGNRDDHTGDTFPYSRAPYSEQSSCVVQSY